MKKVRSGLTPADNRGGYDDHAFGHILQGYAQTHCPVFAPGCVAHAHPRCHAFGQFVQGYGHDEKHHMVEQEVLW